MDLFYLLHFPLSSLLPFPQNAYAQLFVSLLSSYLGKCVFKMAIYIYILNVCYNRINEHVNLYRIGKIDIYIIYISIYLCKHFTWYSTFLLFPLSSLLPFPHNTYVQFFMSFSVNYLHLEGDVWCVYLFGSQSLILLLMFCFSFFTLFFNSIFKSLSISIYFLCREALYWKNYVCSYRNEVCVIMTTFS